VSASVLYMSMSLDGYIAGPNDAPGNPGGDGFMRLHEWFVASDGQFFRPDATLEFAHTPLSVLAENFIVLRFAEYMNRLYRLMAILKMRFSDYDPTLYEYSITADRGIALVGPAPSACSRESLTLSPVNPVHRWARVRGSNADHSRGP